MNVINSEKDAAGRTGGASLEKTGLSDGWTTAQAEDRLRRFGPNEIPEKKERPLLLFLKKFWGLTAWMLEGIIILSWILGKYPDVGIVSGLLVMNALIGFLEERKAAGAVQALEKNLQVQARTLRDGVWTLIPARQLVPGDILRVRSGDVILADLEIAHGELAVDQSALTGESLTAEKRAADALYAGSVIKRGEATGIVTGTGASTIYGRTAQLIRIARPRLHMEDVVAKLVRWLLLIIGGLLSMTLTVSLIRGSALFEILPLMLILLLSAIPVALPVMFTVSMAVGARELVRKNVLITRLSATEDAATMDVLCVDKTGTLTLNEMALAHIIPLGPFSEEDVVLYGALASQEANQDPLDLAFVRAAQQKGLLPSSYVQERFIPFEPGTRKTEAFIRDKARSFRAMKGAVSAIAQICGIEPPALIELEARIGEFSKKGYRTLAVATDEGSKPTIVGLAALSDSLRPDSRALIEELQELGVSIKMLTGDALPIAQEIGQDLGIRGTISRITDLKLLLTTDPAQALRMMETSGGFAEVYPEDKFVIVKSLQAGKHVVGMTGDGVNDAPALKQAEVGIAVSRATDVAKASAGVVLMDEGLSGIVELVKNGRKVYQRIQTWVLNKIMRTFLKSSFVIGVFLVSGTFAVTAFAMVLLLLMTDFVKIALSTDHVRWSKSPDTWNITRDVKVAIVLGLLMAMESFALFWGGLRLGHFSLSDPAVITLSFDILLFSALSSIFVVRERRRFWKSSPSRLMAAVVLLDILAGTLISTLGIPGALARLPLGMTLFVVGSCFVLSLAVNDYIKVLLRRRAGLG